jgi:hypothetical protein
MSEENNASEVTTEGGEGGDSGVSPGSSGGDSGVSQASMAGDFFMDNGSGAWVDHAGNPIRDKDGREFNRSHDKKTVEAYLSGLAAPSVKPQTTPTGKQSPTAINGLFGQDGKADLTALTRALEKVNMFRRPAVDFGNAPPTQASPVVSKDPIRAIHDQVGTFYADLFKTRLQPIVDLWTAFYPTIKGQPADVQQQHKRIFDTAYDKQKAIIDRMAQDKDMMLRDEHLRSASTRVDPKEIETKSAQSLATVGSSIFGQSNPNKNIELTNNLIFGKVDPATKKLVQQGFGIDIVEHLFHAAAMGIDGKALSFKSNQDYLQSLQKWWVNFSSDPARLSIVARAAYDRLNAMSETQKRDFYRAAWDKETRARGVQNQQRPPQSAGNAGMGTDSATKQISEFLGPATKHF